MNLNSRNTTKQLEEKAEEWRLLYNQLMFVKKRCSHPQVLQDIEMQMALLFEEMYMLADGNFYAHLYITLSKLNIGYFCNKSDGGRD
jgi:hypothetical protein